MLPADGEEEESKCADSINPFCGVAEDLKEKAQDTASGMMSATLNDIASAIVEAVGEATVALGSAWIFVPTPKLVGGSGGNPEQYTTEVPKASATAGSGLVDALSWTAWISLGICVLALIFLGAQLAWRARQGDGGEHVGKIAIVLVASVIIGAASGIASALLGSGPSVDGSSTVVWLQRHLWYYVGFAVVLSVIVGAARMAWQQHADPGKELLKSLITLVVVTGAGLTVLSIAIRAADGFASWLVLDSADEDFGKRVLDMLAMSNPANLAFGAVMAMVLGLFALLTSVIQIILMIVRDGILVIIAGTLPIAAAITNTEMGKSWFKQYCAWTLALVLYKPAAAIIYAAAFQLVGSGAFHTVDADGEALDSSLINVLIGLSLMIMALVALPALMKLVAPAASLGGGSAAVGALAGASGAVGGKLASGAMEAGNSGAGAGTGGGGSGGEGSGRSEPDGADTASDGPQGAEQKSGQATSGDGGQEDDATGAQNPAAKTGGSDASGAEAGAGAEAGSGAASTAAGADPYTMAAQKGMEIASSVNQAAQGTMEEAAEGPDGS